jgi:hypothetical protein
MDTITTNKDLVEPLMISDVKLIEEHGDDVDLRTFKSTRRSSYNRHSDSYAYFIVDGG